MKEIPLTNSDLTVMVSECDYESLMKYKWYLNRNGYAQRTDKRSYITIGKSLVGGKSGLIVDHINRNRLDDRRENLRLVTVSQNQMNKGLSKNNTSGYKGITFVKGKWYAKISKNRIRYESKSFSSALEAAKAYDQLAILHHGEYAYLNCA